MELFLICPQTESIATIEVAIKATFDSYYIELPERNFPIWIVATNKYKTPFEVSEKLDITQNAEKVNYGIVVEIDKYWGCDYESIWNKLQAWEEE